MRKPSFATFRKLLFFLTIVFLPTQFGKHFWPFFSFISGIQVDYLSPTLYLTDVFIILLFIFSLRQVCNSLSTIQVSKFKFQIVFGVILIVGIVLSKSPWVGWYGFLKLSEMIFFGFYTKDQLKNPGVVKRVIMLLSIGVVFESTIAIAQYMRQQALGGIFYLFGERWFTSQTPGIANASLSGNLVLRPYGTFSHPNVLSAFLLLATVFILQKEGFKKQTIVLTVLSSAALLLTLSRISILLWIFVLCFFIFGKKKILKRQSLTVFFLTLVMFLIVIPVIPRFASLSLIDESFVVRRELIQASLRMALNHPLFGVGLNNFLPNLMEYQKLTTGSFFTLFQPVHNIYLLVLSEIGVVGFLLFAFFLATTYRRSKDAKILFIVVLGLGFFDHYFLTLQQGQLLFSFVLAYCWAK